LPQRFESIGAGELSRLFGEKFENALQTLPIGQWSGPVLSGYGSHLVLLRQRDEERLAPLAEVREQVRREWIDARRAEGNARFYADLRRRYEVTIQRPTASGEMPNPPVGLR
jgi:parvulin-like peptidyl-prolyl isomerase